MTPRKSALLRIIGAALVALHASSANSEEQFLQNEKRTNGSGQVKPYQERRDTNRPNEMRSDIAVPTENVAEMHSFCTIATTSLNAEVIAQERVAIVEMETIVNKRISDLEDKILELKSLIAQREQIAASVTGAVVNIYSRMSGEAAAAQIAQMPVELAGAILQKLNPKSSSGILSNIESEKAAHILSAMTSPVARPLRGVDVRSSVDKR